VNSRKHRGFSAKSPGPARFDQVDSRLTAAGGCGLSVAAGLNQGRWILIQWPGTLASGLRRR
jgi:hypothetical protein